MSSPSLPTIIGIPSGLAVLWAAIRYLYRRIRSHDVTEVFVHDMATNHLPHIYHALQILCEREGVKLPDPPPLQFMDFRRYHHKEED